MFFTVQITKTSRQLCLCDTGFITHWFTVKWLNQITKILIFVTVAETLSRMGETICWICALCLFCFAVCELTLCFLPLSVPLYLSSQAIVYEGQDKNPEMCRVLLTHEIMCRWVKDASNLFLLPKSSSSPLHLQTVAPASTFPSSPLLQRTLFICRKFSPITPLYSIHFLFCHPH